MTQTKTFQQLGWLKWWIMTHVTTYEMSKFSHRQPIEDPLCHQVRWIEDPHSHQWRPRPTHLVISKDLAMTHLVISEDLVKTHLVVSNCLVTTLTEDLAVKTLTIFPANLTDESNNFLFILCNKNNKTGQWKFLIQQQHQHFHQKDLCITRSTTMTLIATSPVAILPLGLVKFVLFQKKLHHFYRANFVT